MGYFAAAEATKESAVTRTTQADQSRAWKRWREWCAEVGLSKDLFLDSFTSGQKIKLLGAFAMALRQGRFSPKSNEPLVESTIRSSILYVAQTFRENDRPNPTKDEDGELGRFLSRLFRAFKNQDPKPTQQKALPAVVLRQLSNMRFSESQIAIGELAIGAFFFACRSCEYLKVPAAEKKKTEILRLKDIRFFRDGSELQHSNLHLEFADSVSLHFSNQKNGVKNDIVTHQRTGDTLFCPTRILAKIVKRIRNYKGASDDTPISAVWRNNKIEHITSKEMTTALRNAVEAFGQEKLGLRKEEIGTHSIRSGAAMAMYLGQCPVYVIMMIGRWSSDAFLVYIRKQVEQFSNGISSKMLRFQFHRHIQDQEIGNPKYDQKCNPSDFVETKKNIIGRMAQQARVTALPFQR